MGIHALSISQGRSPNCKGTALKVRSVAVSEECGFETCPAADRWEGTREAESSGLVLSMSLDYSSVNFLMIIVILLVILLLVALTGFCVWRRKRKQSGKCGSPGGAVADLTPQREAPGSSAPALPPEGGGGTTTTCVHVWGRGSCRALSPRSYLLGVLGMFTAQRADVRAGGGLVGGLPARAGAVSGGCCSCALWASWGGRASASFLDPSSRSWPSGVEVGL